MVTAEQIKESIETALPGAKVSIDGDGRHFTAVVISDIFRGKSVLEQHKIVYDALGERVQMTVHSLSVRTYTRQEWERGR